jgi:hypothetical protein
VTAEASRDRLALASQAGSLGLALDAADTIQAQDSLEKMLVHHGHSRFGSGHGAVAGWRQSRSICATRADDLVEAERRLDACAQHSRPHIFQNFGVVKDFIDVDLPT